MTSLYVTLGRDPRGGSFRKGGGSNVIVSPCATFARTQMGMAQMGTICLGLFGLTLLIPAFIKAPIHKPSEPSKSTNRGTRRPHLCPSKTSARGSGDRVLPVPPSRVSVLCWQGSRQTRRLQRLAKYEGQERITLAQLTNLLTNDFSNWPHLWYLFQLRGARNPRAADHERRDTRGSSVWGKRDPPGRLAGSFSRPARRRGGRRRTQ